MTSAIIISICVLLLIAYIFDVSSPKTRIPSVILLLLVGWAVRQGANFLGLHIPDLSPILPVIGTVGLILVVLEGSLEVELNRSKLGLIVRSTVVALLPIILLSMLKFEVVQNFLLLHLRFATSRTVATKRRTIHKFFRVRKRTPSFLRLSSRYTA